MSTKRTLFQSDKYSLLEEIIPEHWEEEDALGPTRVWREAVTFWHAYELKVKNFWWKHSSWDHLVTFSKKEDADKSLSRLKEGKSPI